MIIRNDEPLNHKEKVFEILFTTNSNVYIYYVKTENIYAHLGKLYSNFQKLYSRPLEMIYTIYYTDVSETSHNRNITVEEYIEYKEKILIKDNWIKHNDMYSRR